MERWCRKVAVVSGASAGIGAACCKALVQSGMVVVGLARRQELILKLKDELPATLRNNLHAKRCDITQEEQVSKVFDWTQHQLGGCDVLINNAGIIATAQLSQRNNTKEIVQTINTNLMGTVFCTREAYYYMQSHKGGNGHIIIINSVAGHQVPNLGPDLPSLNIYPATKFALKAMNEIYRQEFQRHKTQVRMTKDRMRMTRASKELLEKRAQLRDQFMEYRNKRIAEWKEQKARRIQLRNNVDTDSLNTEEVDEEIVEFLVKEEITVLE